MSIVIVVANPREHSRTRDAAVQLAGAWGARATEIIELGALRNALLDTAAPEVLAARTAVATAHLVIFASPTYKGTYTGLLKLFLEKFDGDTGLAGVSCVPLMLGGSAHHALAPDYSLAPLLHTLGAVTLPGLFLIDSTSSSDDAIAAYASRHAAMFAVLTARSAQSRAARRELDRA